MSKYHSQSIISFFMVTLFLACPAAKASHLGGGNLNPTLGNRCYGHCEMAGCENWPDDSLGAGRVARNRDWIVAG